MKVHIYIRTIVCFSFILHLFFRVLPALVFPPNRNEQVAETMRQGKLVDASTVLVSSDSRKVNGAVDTSALRAAPSLEGVIPHENPIRFDELGFRETHCRGDAVSL